MTNDGSISGISYGIFTGMIESGRIVTVQREQFSFCVRRLA